MNNVNTVGELTELRYNKETEFTPKSNSLTNTSNVNKSE